MGMLVASIEIILGLTWYPPEGTPGLGKYIMHSLTGEEIPSHPISNSELRFRRINIPFFIKYAKELNYLY